MTSKGVKQAMMSTANRKRVMALAVTSAMAGALLSGCTTNAAPSAAHSASQAEQALASGKHSRAVTHAEAAVLAEPHNAAYRSVLASAYLDAGRFASAETTFKDAIQLGDASARNALSLALAMSAQGKYREAQTLLNQWEGRIATADLGLALALAGQPERGVHLMSNAIRGGDNTAKMRQNLAYSYALAGRWREARLMAAQDVPADQIDDRIEQWAQMASPDAWHTRVAGLLQVPAGVQDGGQPVQLALGNNPSLEQLASEAAAAVAVADTSELAPLAVALTPVNEPPAVAAAEPAYEAPPVSRADDFQAAFSAPLPAVSVAGPAPVVADAAQFMRAPAVQGAPARAAASAVAAAPRADGTHLVQLGSFSSEQGARRAWSIYTRNYPELAAHEMVISEAVVRGKRYWRVSAAGFARNTASSICGRVRASGAGCFAYAEGRPLPGAVDRGLRLARR
jgi:Flp pilus assembly protein TadD